MAGSVYAIDARSVGEVVVATAITPIPKVPPSILGLFNLRGTPTPLVDLASVLGLVPAPTALPSSHEEGVTALILRADELVVAARIERMESVIALRGKDAITASRDDNPILEGFLSSKSRTGELIAVLDSDSVFSKLSELRFR